MTVVAIVEVLSRCETSQTCRLGRKHQQSVEKLHEDRGGIVHLVLSAVNSPAVQLGRRGTSVRETDGDVRDRRLDPAFDGWIEHCK